LELNLGPRETQRYSPNSAAHRTILYTISENRSALEQINPQHFHNETFKGAINSKVNFLGPVVSKGP